MVNIKKRGKFFYVEGDDCYIFYSLFKYKIKNNKCFFSKKSLKKVITELTNKKISFGTPFNIYIYILILIMNII